jgi:hypothetical protein
LVEYLTRELNHPLVFDRKFIINLFSHFLHQVLLVLRSRFFCFLSNRAKAVLRVQHASQATRSGEL